MTATYRYSSLIVENDEEDAIQNDVPLFIDGFIRLSLGAGHHSLPRGVHQIIIEYYLQSLSQDTMRTIWSRRRANAREEGPSSAKITLLLSVTHI